jgi:3-mercaptopyruvate sulfurtransferase SseA
MNGGLPAWRDQGLPVETQALSEVGTADVSGDSVSQEHKAYPVIQMASNVIRCKCRFG